MLFRSKTIAVAPGGALATEPVWLQERESSDPNFYNGVYTGTPRPQGYESPPYRERVQLEFANSRNTLPWETEIFQACLIGRKVDIQPVKTAFTYDMKEDPQERGNFFLVPGEKRAMAPDPDGLVLDLFWDADSGDLHVVVADKWAEQYAGEKTELELEVWANNAKSPDAREAKIKLSMDSTPRYEYSLGKVTRFWTNYYVKSRFRRLGRISTDDWTKQIRSKTVANAP